MDACAGENGKVGAGNHIISLNLPNVFCGGMDVGSTTKRAVLWATGSV